MHHLPQAQVQDHAGQGGGAVQGRQPQRQAARLQVVLQGTQAEDASGDRRGRGRVCDAVQHVSLPGVRLLLHGAGQEGQRGTGE